MRWAIAGAVVAIVLLGWVQPWKPAVHLLTGVNPDACYAGGEPGHTGPLLPDAQFGTSFDGQPVMWPDGFSARRAGEQVEVLDAFRLVVATTGRLYHISIAPLDAVGGMLGPDPTYGAYPAAAASCRYPYDLVDCGPVAHPFAPSDAGKKMCAPDAIYGP